MASPSQTPTWTRNKPCGCKGCSVSVKYDRDRILFLIKQIDINGKDNSQLIDIIKGIVEDR